MDGLYSGFCDFILLRVTPGLFDMLCWCCFVVCVDF